MRICGVERRQVVVDDLLHGGRVAAMRGLEQSVLGENPLGRLDPFLRFMLQSVFSWKAWKFDFAGGFAGPKIVIVGGCERGVREHLRDEGGRFHRAGGIGLRETMATGHVYKSLNLGQEAHTAFVHA